MAGSYEKQGKDTYRLFVSGGVGPNGKRKRHTKTVKANSPREAEKLLAQFVAEVEKGQYIEPSRLTFAEYAQRWLRDYAEKNLAPKTLFRYKQYLDSRILPAFGHLKVEQIKPAHLLGFYTNLMEDGIREDGKPGGLSENTVGHHHRLISSMLQDAVDWQIISSNPASRVKPPKVKKKQAACYDEEQSITLLDAVEQEPLKYNVILNLAVYTGLRRGELFGLEWRDIDFDKNTLRVERVSQYIPGQGLITKEPKNETSVRVVSVPGTLMALLKHYKAHQAEERLKVGDLWQASNRLFTTWDGKPMHPDTISKWFPDFLRKYDLPPLPFHGLRHYGKQMIMLRVS